MGVKFLSLISISLLIFASITTIQQQVYPSKDKDDDDDDVEDYDGDGVTEYKNWDGNKFTEKQYLTRVQYCIEMAFYEHLIDVNTKCRQWVLTYEGDMAIADYIVKKYFPR